MEEVVRLSVRQLVEFSIHGEDIQPSGNVQDMMEGMRGHKARQGEKDEGWQIEAPLRLEAEAEGVPFLLTGRMDAYWDGPCPIIEEIKLLARRSDPPREAYPAHRAQAVCYGYMVCEEKEIESACIRVAYVHANGEERAVFEETLSREALFLEFDGLLKAYALWESTQRQHRALRDESLDALSFPYPNYRKGQREMAVQVFTAIRQKKRLFASMPTGTGKSVAVLFPALKALGKGLTGQIFFLTARTTARQGALIALSQMRERGLHAWSLTLTAKERQCPAPVHTRCNPEECPRAKGHFLRLPEALEEMMAVTDWNEQMVSVVADKHYLCPFEFALSLSEIADVVICDYNYAFDPSAHLKRIFDHRTNLTLLIDEAHNLTGRVRSMLSGEADGSFLAGYRKTLSKAVGRKNPLYHALTAAIKTLRGIEMPEGEAEMVLEGLPEGLSSAMNTLMEEAAGAFALALPGEAGSALSDVYSQAAGFVFATGQDQGGYALLCYRRGKERHMKLFCLSVAEHLEKVTRKLSGTVCFSATLSPLHAMRKLLGGGEEDGCYALPSPFPKEHLLVLRKSINTRYRLREETADQVADAILSVFKARPGKYFAFFPSYAYLRLVTRKLEEREAALPLLIQDGNMAQEDRDAFLARFTADDTPLLGMAVLGGIFAEGIDLPGTRLLGVMVVGVGLPMVCLEQEVLRGYYQKKLGDGFAYAYQYPGMHKVLQAAGRVIRTAEDRGVVLLIDQRYFQKDYEALCPPHWQWSRESPEDFWKRQKSPDPPRCEMQGDGWGDVLPD